MSFEFIKPNHSTIIFKFPGYMGTANCVGIDDKIIAAVKDCETITFDLEGVTYISSSFLRLCSIVSTKVTVGKFLLVNVTPTLRKVFKISGLADLVKSS